MMIPEGPAFEGETAFPARPARDDEGKRSIAGRSRRCREARDWDVVDARAGARTAEVDGETAVAGSSADGHAVGANGRGAARLADAGAEHVGSELLGGHGGGHGARDGLLIDARVSCGLRRASGARFPAIARKKRALVIHRETSQLWEATNRPG